MKYEEQENKQLSYPQKSKEKKQRKKRKIVLIALSGLVLFIVFGCAAFLTVRAIGKKKLTDRAESTGPDLTLADTDDISLTEEEKAEWQEGWVKYDGKIYAYNEDILTFLFMGIDKDSDIKEVAEGTDGGQADALFLTVVDPHDKAIRVIGINRNTMTDIDRYDEEGAYIDTIKAQIAVQHGFGNGVEESCEYQKKAVQDLFYNIPIHGYAAINMSAIPTINDAVGGVEVKVLEDLTKADPILAEGADVRLMGRSAFWYVKYRDVKQFASADMRLDRQKQYLNAFIAEAKKAVKKDITVTFDLYRAVTPQMVTDITLDELAYLVPVFADYRFDKDSFYMLEGETVEGELFEEFYVDEDALYELILEVFYEEVDG